MKYLLLLTLSLTVFLSAQEEIKQKQPDPLRYKPIFATMTRKEKIAQMIMAYANVTLVSRYQVGSVIFMGWQVKSQGQIKGFITDIQRVSKIPCMIATDEEGGRVNRFKVFPNARHPAAADVGGYIRSGAWTLDRVRDNAFRVGKTLSAVGVHANLAPILDTSSNGLIKSQRRGYSSDYKEVSRIGRAFIQGFRDAGIICLAKHYPGYGNLSRTTDRYLLRDTRTWDDLEESHLIPFEDNKDMLGGLMLSNICFSNIDREHLTNFSPIFIKRAREDFPLGLLMTDDLRAKSVVEISNDNIEHIAQIAFLSGLDIFLTIKNANVPRIINSIDSLIDRQPELEEHLEKSLARLFYYKEKWFKDFFAEKVSEKQED